MSPIGQRNANGEAYFSQQPGAEDNGNDPSLCRLGQKSNDGNNIIIVQTGSLQKL